MAGEHTMPTEDKEIEIVSYFDENGKSFEELMQELLKVILPKQPR